MKYILKEDKANDIKATYKNSYISKKSGLSTCYISLILNRHRKVAKRIAYCFTKSINSEYEINDLFDLIK